MELEKTLVSSQKGRPFKPGFYLQRSRSRKWHHERAYDSAKIKNRSHMQSHKRDRMGVGRIRMFPFSSDSSYDSVAYNLVKTRLSKLKAEMEG